jgi:signal peptidase I
MSTAKLKELWKKDYFQTAILIVIIVIAVLVLWFGSQTFLGTSNPALAVASGSMCKVHPCDGWSHPFERTLHIGDLIIVQGVNPKEVKTGPDPEGDIIIFHRPMSDPSGVDELIVHRAIENATHNGLVYFRTKGDGNGGADQWGGGYASGDFRGENYTWNNMISEKLVVGKVIMRIPWVGNIALFMREGSAVYLVLALIIILVIVEFGIPALRSRKAGSEPKNIRVEDYD